MEAVLTYDIGRLLCGRVRDYLNKCKFKGMKIEYYESKGFLEREFTIKGDYDDVIQVKRDIDNWARSLETD